MIATRTATIDDVEMIVTSQLAMAWEIERLRLDQSTVSAGVRAVFDDPSKGTYWVAEINAKPAGILLVTPEWSDWRNGTVLWIQSVYTLPEMRGQGVFKALFVTLRRQVLDTPHLVGLRLYVDTNNEPAQAIYRRLRMTKDHYDLYEWIK